MQLTRYPLALSSTPMLLAVTPLPRPETTPGGEGGAQAVAVDLSQFQERLG